MLEEAPCLVGIASSLVVQHDMVNYRWIFYSPEESQSVVIARAPLLAQATTAPSASQPSYRQVQVIHLPSTPQSIALHESTCRIAVACVDGTALLLNPDNPPSSTSTAASVLCDDESMAWHTQATWRCEPDMTCPLKWCESKEDVWLVGVATRVTIWKVVDDAVSVYSSRSFDLGTAMTPLSAELFDACSTGRYVALCTSPHSRLVKVWSLNSWTMEMTAPFCTYLGHSRALRSLEWLRPEAPGVLDNATLMTLDASGTLTLWREDSNASTFGFLRVWVLDDHPIRVGGVISRRKTAPKTLLWEFPTDMNNSMKVWKATVADKTHHLYTHTMDRVHTKSSKSLGFSFRAGATADTHEGEKFIQGNLALSKCSITYFLYIIGEDGDFGVWRVDCTMFLTSTPRATLVCTTSDLREDLKEAVPLHASITDFIPTTSRSAPESLEVAMTLFTKSHELQALRVSVVLPPPSSTLAAGIAGKNSKTQEPKAQVQCTWTRNLVPMTAARLHGIKTVSTTTTHDSVLVVRDGSHHAVAYDSEIPHHSIIPFQPNSPVDQQFGREMQSNDMVVAALTVSTPRDTVLYFVTITLPSSVALNVIRSRDPSTRHVVRDSEVCVDQARDRSLVSWEGMFLLCSKEEAGIATPSTLFRIVAITNQGEIFLWRLHLPDDVAQPPRCLGKAAVGKVVSGLVVKHAGFVNSSSGSLFVTVGTALSEVPSTGGAVHFWRFSAEDATADEMQETCLSVHPSRPPLPLLIGLRHVELDGSGLMALLLMPSSSPPTAPSSSLAVHIQHVWDRTPASRWNVSTTVTSLAWLNRCSQVVALSPTALFGFHVDGTPLFAHNLHPGVTPSSLCVSRRQATMYLAHTAFVTQVELPTTSTLSTVRGVWSPMNLLHLMYDGRFKAAQRVLQTLVDAITLNENQSYMEMKESQMSMPWMSWSNVCYDSAGIDDRATFTKQIETAANLFAPRVPVSKASRQDTGVNFEAFFSVANDHRLRFVPEAERDLFRTICTMFNCEADAKDLPSLRFMVHLMLVNESGGMCAEAMVWARLTSMDLFTLPFFQNLTMEWSLMQKLRLPFWLDDIQRLKLATEQVANREYAASKDPFSIALYYVLLGKTRLLSNLFRLGKETKIADLLVNDFADDRWKAAAIKNAFVLKSKQRYLLAATFFLLGNKVYEAASMAESADPTFVLSFLILRLSEPSSLKQLGPTTIQFVQTVLLDKAVQANDVYMQCLCRLFLDKRLVLAPFLAQPTLSPRSGSERMTCVFQTTASAYWLVSASSLYGACRLIQHGWTMVDESDEPMCMALHCMAATRLLAQGYSFLGYTMLSDMAQVFSSMVHSSEYQWLEGLRHELSLACVSDQLHRVCALFGDAVNSSLVQPYPPFAFNLTAHVDAVLSYFPNLLPSQVVCLVRPHSTVAWMTASHDLVGTSDPVLAQVHTITNAMVAPGSFLPSRVLRATQALIEYLHVMLPQEEPNVIRLATGAIYTGLFVVFPIFARRLPSCCVVRLVSLMCPQKEIIHSGSIRTAIESDDVCLTCLDFKPRLLPSLRQDLPALHAMVAQVLALATPSFKPSTSTSCWYWTTLLALLHDTMEQHVVRLTEQIDIAESLQDTWKAYYTPRIVKNDPCRCVRASQCPLGEQQEHGRDQRCAWHKLIQLICPGAAAALVLSKVVSPVQGGASGADQPPQFSETIYSSDVPGEAIRGMCCNNQQKNTVVFCNGRFLYRAVAKKPPKTSSSTASCQLHVNAKYTPPAVFFAGDSSDQLKLPTPSVLSPQPDSKGNGSYKPVAVQSHPAMPLFCSGTAKGTVEVWRFDQTASCNVFEHHVAPVLSANPLAPLTSAPRRDVHRIRFANSGYTLGACDALGYVYLWNFASEGSSACYAHLQCHNRGTRDFAFLNASSCVASVGSSTKKKNLCLWDTLLPPHKALICAPLCHPVGAVSIVFSSRHQLILSGGDSGSLNIFDVRQQRVLYAVSTAHDCAITTLALHPQGHCVLSGSATGDVKIWSLPLFRELCSWSNSTNSAKLRQQSSSFLGEASATFTTAAVTGITDAFATEDFFYASGSDGVIQRYQTPAVTFL
ncbi:hypothetical protein H310_07999 [Aphanomyces invadans]|uniref:RAVE complex protein Rav1 C-terminal domain-containing protein n=1 Tax=Aphanomyces invadans TaxID=157072 RepID=A0A024TZ11_9STRA|nr:hypothetical protein H310_07999 [Aphanomyces invadans]ETV99253.1 hypothetical protein H310_07999 [Aphanomyces invadans]|eukprot:XP_008871809.1 hypothetical protein H310_07999 [Aphanomyces invadans]